MSRARTTAAIPAVTRNATRRSVLLVAAPTFLLVLALLVALPAVADASNASLKRTLLTWSHQLGADARGIGLSASRRHPRRMMLRANQFRRDALLARRAVAAQRPSGARGLRARRLALAAFRDYAIVGREWALSGKARLSHQNALATRHAQIAKRLVSKGDRKLIAAAKLLR